ncbi:MAG: hypothetical protein ABSD96_11905 [Candidatus Korobacteraceae bacterium]
MIGCRRNHSIGKTFKRIGFLLILAAQFAWGQGQQGPQGSGVQIGENTHVHAAGLLTGGYTGDYGDQTSSDHNVAASGDGEVSGYYYTPNFISFDATPYYNQSRADSNSQSISGASGVSTAVNLFTGSHFPGSVNYHMDDNSTGLFGLSGQPNFTTKGRDQGFGIGWSALLPNLPTLSVGYSQGSGDSTIYGTSQMANSNSRIFNLRSSYQLLGFRLSGSFNDNSFDSQYPAFLAGQQETASNSHGHSFGFNANHALPVHGTFAASYSRSSFSTDEGTTATSYTTSTENANANFHPTRKFEVFANESYTDNLSGALAQTLVNSGAVPPTINLGSSSQSLTLGGGVGYQFTNYLNGSAQVTRYQQYYFGTNLDGTYASGTVNYGKRLLDMFTFSASVVDSHSGQSSNVAGFTGQGANAVGFIGNANYFHPFGRWATSGSFSYAQNVQTLLITYTTSSYNYNARLERRFRHGIQWIAAFNGSHTGLTNQPDTASRSEGYSTSFSMRRFALNANYNSYSGNSLLSTAGLTPVLPTPGLPVSDLINYLGSSYSGGVSATPLRHFTVSGTYGRSISDTNAGGISSSNNTEILNGQLQYHFRRISMLAGYTRLNQGISVIGAPVSVTSYFVGVSRWFNFF